MIRHTQNSYDQSNQFPRGSTVLVAISILAASFCFLGFIHPPSFPHVGRAPVSPRTEGNLNKPAQPSRIPHYPEAIPIANIHTPQKSNLSTNTVQLTSWGNGYTQNCEIPFEAFFQGEYVGPARSAHLPKYYLRVNDQLEFIFRITRQATAAPYRLNVGDTLKIESIVDEKLSRELVIQPDGNITLQLLGQVRAAGQTVTQLRNYLENRYQQFYNVAPSISVLPTKVNTRLEDLRAAVDSRAGDGGQARQATITPEGTIQLPAIGNVPAQGLTLEELKEEVDLRYREVVQGIEVTPVLHQRAPTTIYVVGEVAAPGRYSEINNPLSLLQAISLAGGWNNGADLKSVVVLRRTENWQLIATRLDIHQALHGKDLHPQDDIWLRDSDIVIVPKTTLRVVDDYIDLLFTRGLYGIFPLQSSINFSKASTL
ncbi:MAG: polysaccharide biosynthesis/export family protein [Pirellulaceae bacterium]|nr:polysaccharide biosynthesis/export family protein [Pirellulaceae bacterium]